MSGSEPYDLSPTTPRPCSRLGQRNCRFSESAALIPEVVITGPDARRVRRWSQPGAVASRYVGSRADEKARSSPAACCAVEQLDRPRRKFLGAGRRYEMRRAMSLGTPDQGGRLRAAPVPEDLMDGVRLLEGQPAWTRSPPILARKRSPTGTRWRRPSSAYRLRGGEGGRRTGCACRGTCTSRPPLP